MNVHEALIKRIFDGLAKIDKDGDGTVSFLELKQALRDNPEFGLLVGRNIHSKLSEHDVEVISKEIAAFLDKDGDGEITYAAQRAFLLPPTHPRARPPPPPNPPPPSALPPCISEACRGLSIPPQAAPNLRDCHVSTDRWKEFNDWALTALKTGAHLRRPICPSARGRSLACSPTHSLPQEVRGPFRPARHRASS